MGLRTLRNYIKYRQVMKQAQSKKIQRNKQLYKNIDKARDKILNDTTTERHTQQNTNKDNKNNEKDVNDIFFFTTYNQDGDDMPEMIKLLQDLQKLNIQNTKQSYIKEKKYSDDLKENSDPLYQYNCIENVGFSYVDMIKNNTLLDSASRLAMKSGPLVLSDINYLNLVWIYRRYKLLIDKIMCYHLNRIFCFLKIYNTYLQDNKEEQEEFDKTIQEAQNYLQYINKSIFDAILLSEKYGGSVIILPDDIDKTAIIYNRFDIQTQTSNNITFKDGKTYNIDKNIIILSSSYTCDTLEEKQRREGWGYAWLDISYEFLTTTLKSLASINEFISKMQIMALYSNKLANENYGQSGYNPQQVLSKLSHLTNNGVALLSKDNEQLDFLTSNINIAPIMDFLTTELSIFWSVPKSLFNEDAGSSGVINNGQDKLGTKSSLNECNRIKQHYQPVLNKILDFIYEKYIQKNIVDRTNLIIDTNLQQHETTKMEEIEYKLKEAELEEKQANIKETQSRFNFKPDE